ncbi:Sulfate transporter 4.1, chloroplastic [Seminavis robusta]|uniref:Sulfate transporter 4.1, chloroplastic n=1 Tax=Seminavis robusta TaxID=568900 RepID=A0A9N8H676_9STRA|nr:Sulfate transporter 4.1, chloroplastic [Seminavis robusta]|eukprot:Sro104_g053000.1 Sulfate transporter 4.1, chloroplastic (771) ;mRNA; r:99564-102061
MTSHDEAASKDGSAATTGTSQSVSTPPEEQTVTVHPLASDDNKARRRFVTTHRKTLEHINRDSLFNTRYEVPDQKRKSASSWPKKTLGAMHDKAASRSAYDWLEVFLPMAKWLKTYKVRDLLLQDAIAGCTVGVMVVPQSMSYAKLAGLPVEYGLYSALVPVYAYAFFGSSRQLAVGPVALISLMLSTGLTHELAKTGHSPEDEDYQAIYNTLAIQVAFLVGCFYIILGVLRLGFITIFLSHAVISGFTTGAAVIIGMSQVKYIFGYDVKGKTLHKVLKDIFANISEFNYKTFLVGILSIIALVTMKHIGKTYPKFKWMRAIGPLTVCTITIVLNVIFDLEGKGIPVVGAIPVGLPPVTADQWFPIESAGDLMLVVFSITIVGFMESIAIGKQLANKHKYELDSSTELIGLGMANLCGAMFMSYPVTGSFSRSAVNNEAGAKSGISGIVTATIVMLVLLFLTPVFEQMPLAVLAAIVISGVLGLLDYPEAIYLWKVHKFDFAVWLIACLGTMFLGVEIGLAIAVAVSLLLVTYESAYPHTAVLGRLPGTTVYRNIKQYPEAERYDGIVMVRIDAPIYFANTQNVREKISKYERQAEEQLIERNGSVKYVVLEFSPVSHIDTSALHILEDIYTTYRDRGIQLCICNPGVTVMEKLVLSGLADSIGRRHIFTSLHDCVNWCLDEMDNVESSVHGFTPDDVEESLATNDDIDDDNNPPPTNEQQEESDSKGGSAVGMVFAADDIEAEIKEQIEIDSEEKGVKVTFASLGTGQL